MQLKEAYIQYDAAKDLMYYHIAGSSISLNASDSFYVKHDGQWHWTPLCWSQERGWYLGTFPEWNIQTGERIPVTVQDPFEECCEDLKPGNPDECPSNVYEWGLCDDCEYYEECAGKTDVSRYFKE